MRLFWGIKIRSKVIRRRLASRIGDFKYRCNKELQERVFDQWWYKRLLVRYNQIPMPGYQNLPLAEVLHYMRLGFSKGRVWQRAKGLAYSLLMALPPLLIFLFTLVAYLPMKGVQNTLLEYLQGIVPGNIYDRLSELIYDVMDRKHGSLMSIGFLTSVILATNGIHGCLMSMNYNHDSVKQQGLAKRYVVCLFLVFLLFTLLVVAMGLMVGYQHILNYLMEQNWIAPSKLSMLLFNFGRWVIMVMLTLFVLTSIYRCALPRKQRKLLRFFSVGSVIATLLFFVLTWAFQIYLDNFNNYNILYGSIGTILVLMLWLFANCYVMLVGYEINVTVVRSRQDARQWRVLRKESWAKVRERRNEALRMPRKPVAQEEVVVEEKPQYVSLNVEMTLRKNPDGSWTTVDSMVKNQ